MKSFLAMMLCAVPALVAAPQAKVVEELARTEVIARLVWVKDIPCMHRTALCPDKCNHGGLTACFEVLHPLSYEKKGEYGDPKPEAGTKIHIALEHVEEGQAIEIVEEIKKMKPLTLVQLTHVHEYVKNEGSSYPVRRIIKLAPAPRLECSGPPQSCKK